MRTAIDLDRTDPATRQPRTLLPPVALLAGLLPIGGYVLPSVLVEAVGFLVLAGYGGRELLRSRRRGRSIAP
jgi:hypothetical protein